MNFINIKLSVWLETISLEDSRVEYTPGIEFGDLRRPKLKAKQLIFFDCVE